MQFNEKLILSVQILQKLEELLEVSLLLPN